MEGYQVVAERHVTHVQQADSTLIVACRQHLTGVVLAWCEWYVDYTGFDCSASSHSPVALAEFLDLVEHTLHFLHNDFAFVYNSRYFAEVLVFQHIDDLLRCTQSGSVGFLGRDTHSLVRSLHDNLCSLCKCTGCRAPRDNTERLCLVLWETAHPLVEHCGYTSVLVAELIKVFAGHDVERTYCGNVLNEVSTLPISNSKVAYSLCCSEHCFDHSHRI